MIDKKRLRCCNEGDSLMESKGDSAAAQPPEHQSCSNYRYIVASEGLEPPPTEPKSVVRPTHREAEPSELRYVEAYAL